MLYEFHLHGFLKGGRLGPLLLPVSCSPTQVLLQVTYLVQHLDTLPHQARSHPPGSGAGCWTFILLLILLFGVTLGLGSLVLVLRECMCEPGFRPLGLLAWPHRVLLAGLGCMSPGHCESCQLQGGMGSVEEQGYSAWSLPNVSTLL